MEATEMNSFTSFGVHKCEVWSPKSPKSASLYLNLVSAGLDTLSQGSKGKIC